MDNTKDLVVKEPLDRLKKLKQRIEKLEIKFSKEKELFITEDLKIWKTFNFKR